MPETATFHPSAHLLQEVIHLSNEVERELVRLLGINLTDYRALVALGASGPVTAGVLAGRIGASAATTTAVLNRLERRGYVQRDRTHPDRRRVLVRVTPQVAARIQEHMGPLMDLTNQHILTLPGATQDEVAEFLRVVADLLRDHAGRLADEGGP